MKTWFRHQAGKQTRKKEAQHMVQGGHAQYGCDVSFRICRKSSQYCSFILMLIKVKFQFEDSHIMSNLIHFISLQFSLRYILVTRLGHYVKCNSIHFSSIQSTVSPWVSNLIHFISLQFNLQCLLGCQI